MKSKLFPTIESRFIKRLIKNRWLNSFTLLLLMLSFCLPSNAQYNCHTSHSKDSRQKILNEVPNSRNLDHYYVKIYMHVIRRSNGSGGHSPAAVDQAFSILEDDFSPHNIFFVWDCSIDYINNTTYYNSNGTLAIFNMNSHADGIDIYLFPDAPGQMGNGMAQATPSSAFYVSGNFWNSPFQSLTTSSVTSHEMGHCLGLYHTHSTFCGTQLVNDPNCNSCGDLICDTPADPHLGFNVNQFSCEWQGGGNDPNGVPYNPDETMIMAYTHPSCMSTFSNGQGQRMRNVLGSVLQNVTTSGGVGPMSGPTNVTCGAYFSIPFISGATYNWSWQGGSCASFFGYGPSVYLYSTCSSSGTGGLLCVTVNTGCDSEFADFDVCRTLNVLPCGGWWLDDPGKEDASASTRGVEKRSINIYPNPAFDIVTVELEGEGQTRLELIDVKGAVVSRQSTDLNSVTFDVSTFNSGLYFVRIYTEDGKVQTKKVLVNH